MPKFKKSSVSNSPPFLHEGNKNHNQRHADGKAHPLKKVGKVIKKGVNTGKKLVKKGKEVINQAASDLKEGFESANEMSAFNLEGSKKTQRLRNKVLKTRKKWLQSEVNSKKDQRLFDREMRQTDRLRASHAKDKESANEMSAFNLDPDVNAAKEKAIKGGFDKATADNVFKMEPKNINKKGFKAAGNPTYQKAMMLDPTKKDPNSFSFDGISLSDSGLNVGDEFNFGDKFGSITDLTDTSTPSYTVKGFSGSKDFQSAFGKARASGLSIFDFGGKKYNTNLSTDPNFGKDKIVAGTNSFSGTFNSPGTPDKPEVRIDAFDNKETRGRERKVIFQERKNKRAAIKEARAQAKVDGLKGKAKREYIKKEKNQAKLNQAQNKSSRLKTIRDQSILQEKQGINTAVGKKGRVVSEKAVKGSNSTPAKLGYVSFKDFMKTKGNAMKPGFKMKPLKMNYKK